MSIIYIDRKGHKRQGETGQDRLLAFIYGHAVTRCLIRPFLSPVVSRIGGAFLDTRISGLAVPGFVKKNGIDLSLYEKQIFDSYNDFFTRKIRAEERPVNPVDDYHRYCYAADGRKSGQRKIAGILHTVNPVANDVCPIYKMNSREYCLIKTEQFGTLLQMEVGALMVGKISNNQQGLGFVHKGVEKGRFEFGGSTIILLTQKNVVIPDRDLLEHTGSGMETLVKMGEQIQDQKQVKTYIR